MLPSIAMTPDPRTCLAAFKAALDMSFKTIPGGMGLEKENIEQWGRGYKVPCCFHIF